LLCVKIWVAEVMKVIFLGTNGWYNTETGNTPCVLVDTESYYIVFDAGDGIYKLDKYITSDKPIYLFLSHFHLEHIGGFHILNKFRFKQGIRIYGQEGSKKILNYIIDHPFTSPINNLPIKVKIRELSEGTHRIPFRVTCRLLVHTDPCFGYRIDLGGKVITYCTDTGICNNGLDLAKNADILIHDCAEKSEQRSWKWPHTTPREAAELARKAQVKQLVLFHFSAAVYKSIEERKEAERYAREIFKNTVGAMDGMEISV
jgi:ribonuclease BN (tRNA processing enzyme)